MLNSSGEGYLGCNAELELMTVEKIKTEKLIVVPAPVCQTYLSSEYQLHNYNSQLYSKTLTDGTSASQEGLLGVPVTVLLYECLPLVYRGVPVPA